MAYGDTDECAGGVTVNLKGSNGGRTVKTNNFGDFEFEGLEDNAEYSVIISAPKYKEQELQVKTQKDIYLGVIMLDK